MDKEESKVNMSNKTIKLVANLTFDESREADIISMIEYLNSHHKTGQFLSGLIRLAMDCPEIIMKNTNGEIELGASMTKVTVDGISTLRRDFMNSLSAKVDKLWEQVADIRKMTLQVYTLAQMNKFVGLEGKSENTLRASFVLERQLSDLQKSLGTLINDKQFIDVKLKNSKEFADETLEYIITTYDGIVNEIRNQFSTVNNMVNQTIGMASTEPKHIDVHTKIDEAQSVIKEDTKPEPVVEQAVAVPEVVKQEVAVPEVSKLVEETKVVTSTVNTTANSTAGDDDIVDFGSDPDDLAALANFFGE